MTILTSAYLLRLGICVLPALAFLGVLMLLDSFKLAPMRRVFVSLGAGGAVAWIAFEISELWLGSGGVPHNTWLNAPLAEELLKAFVLVWLIRSGRIGFLVEGAIYGFAIGAGFATIENIVYLHYLGNTGLFLWLVRGLGTAMMHGGGTAIVGILAASQAHRSGVRQALALAAGWAVGSGIHILYNSPLLSPSVAAAMVLAGVPVLMGAIFTTSERAVEHWLGAGFDADMELLSQIASGEFGQTPAGLYLRSMRASFAPQVVADMFCVLQVCTELAIRAKAEVLKREAGFEAPRNPEIEERLVELRFLEKHIGATGRLAIAPLLGARSRRLWELRQMGYSAV